MGDSEGPHLLVDPAALLDDPRIKRFHSAYEKAVVLKDGEDDPIVTKQPIVVGWKVDTIGQVAW